MLITSLPPLRNVRTAPVSMLAPELMTMADPSLVADVSTTLARSALTSTADDLSGTLFGLSLVPWLAMLYWLKHPVVGAPPGVSFGLTYLLARPLSPRGLQRNKQRNKQQKSLARSSEFT